MKPNEQERRRQKEMEARAAKEMEEKNKGKVQTHLLHYQLQILQLQNHYQRILRQYIIKIKVLEPQFD